MSVATSKERRKRQSTSPFDRFAEESTQFVSRGTFFAGCVLLVLIWVPSYFAFRNIDTWQLVINTATTIVTFLLVALLQNAARRSDRAVHHKLDALADGLADLMEYHLSGDTGDLKRDIEDLKHSVGLEKRLIAVSAERGRTAPAARRRRAGLGRDRGARSGEPPRQG